MSSITKRSVGTLTGLLVVFGLLTAQMGPYYDPNTEVQVKGKVVEVREVPSHHGMGAMVEAEIQAEDGTTYTVILGPRWYLSDKLSLKPGEEIEVVGSRQMMGMQNVLMAREIMDLQNQERLRLREANGFPCWVEPGPYRWRMTSKYQKTLEGKVIDLTVTAPPRGFYPMVTATVETPEKEKVKVMLGPSWFIGDRVQVGDPLVVTGFEATWDHEKVLMASEIENQRLQVRLQLRDAAGMPMWSHMGMMHGRGMMPHMGGGYGPQGRGGMHGWGGMMGNPGR